MPSPRMPIAPKSMPRMRLTWCADGHAAPDGIRNSPESAGEARAHDRNWRTGRLFLTGEGAAAKQRYVERGEVAVADQRVSVPERPRALRGVVRSARVR